jgi:transposase
MWTNENRGRYDRIKLRYPSDLTDDEWALVALLIPRQAWRQQAYRCHAQRR